MGKRAIEEVPKAVVPTKESNAAVPTAPAEPKKTRTDQLPTESKPPAVPEAVQATSVRPAVQGTSARAVVPQAAQATSVTTPSSTWFTPFSLQASMPRMNSDTDGFVMVDHEPFSSPETVGGIDISSDSEREAAHEELMNEYAEGARDMGDDCEAA